MGSLSIWRHGKLRLAGAAGSAEASARMGRSAEILSPARGRPMLYQLHLLRAFAVLLVVLDHSCLAINERIPMDPLFIQLAWLAGFLGVAIFFTISGYIMVETTRSQKPSERIVLSFLYRRVLRIVPMYYLATGLCVLAALAHRGGSTETMNPVTVIASLLFIPIANARDVMEPVLGQGWTLNNEMFFYLLFGVSLTLPTGIRAATLAFLLVGLVAGAAMLGWAGYDIGPTGRFLAAPIVLNFISGLLLASYGRVIAARGSPWRPVLLILIVSIGLFVIVTYAAETQPDHVIVFGWWLHAAVFTVAAWCCWLCTRSNTPFPTDGVEGGLARLGILLGDASYATYLFHLFVIAAVVRLSLIAGAGAAETGFYCVTLAIGITAILHRVVEQPVNAWIRQLTRRRRRHDREMRYTS